MKVKDIVSHLSARVITGAHSLDESAEYCFASDLMSDVLTLRADNMLLITGLANVQTIRTAEMSDIKTIVFVRKKKVTPDMIELATENEMVLIECDYTMFKSSGILYSAGLQPVY